MYIVFSIEHPSTTSVYIGYCQRDDATPVEHFLRGAQRPEMDRKDVEFLSQCDDSSQLSWRSISEAENEWEALVARNIARVSNPRSFTGPSMWPLGAYERAQKELGEDVQRPFSAWKALEQRTARAAYEMGLWSFEEIKKCVAQSTRSAVNDDLAQLSPREFAAKYNTW